MWYECKIKYTRMGDDDKVKTFNQSYLFDALTFTEAETRVNKQMSEYISTEFKVTNIKPANFSQVIPCEGEADRWFKCKLVCIYFDQERATEKKANSYILIQANDLKEAYEMLSENIAGTVNDFEIPAIAESPILDVFPYPQEELASEEQNRMTEDSE